MLGTPAISGTPAQKVQLAATTDDADAAAMFGMREAIFGPAKLSKAIPNLPQIQFLSSSADESKLLLSAGSDVDPGRY